MEEGILAGIDALAEAYTTGEPQAAIGAFLASEGEEEAHVKLRSRHASTHPMNFDKRRRLLKHASVMRTRQIPGDVPDVGYDGRAPPYAYAGPMGEPPAGRDEQIGQMFRNMRSAMGVSRETIARTARHQPFDHRQLRGRRHRRVAALEGNGEDCPQLLRAVCGWPPSRS